MSRIQVGEERKLGSYSVQTIYKLHQCSGSAVCMRNNWLCNVDTVHLSLDSSLLCTIWFRLSLVLLLQDKSCRKWRQASLAGAMRSHSCFILFYSISAARNHSSINRIDTLYVCQHADHSMLCSLEQLQQQENNHRWRLWLHCCQFKRVTDFWRTLLSAAATEYEQQKS